jgi:3-oxoacyl-[acyl-carrier-protein] synthase II
MKRRRVKITGIGAVTAAGIGRQEFWRNVNEPVSHIKPFDKVAREWGKFSAAWIETSLMHEGLELTPALRASARHTRMAVLAAKQAFDDANLDIGSLASKRVGVFSGTSLMDFGAITTETESVAQKGLKGVHARLVFSASVAHVAATVGDSLGLRTRNMTYQSSCCSGLDAIGHAAQAIGNGECDLIVCGGTEAPLFKHPMIEFRAVGMTTGSDDRASEQCRPFDLWRTTGVIGEGAAFLILEPEDSPRAPIAEIVGYGFASDPPEVLCGGMAQAIRLALGDAQMETEAVDVISAWGPGHRLIDAAEARQLRGVFGDRIASVPTYSIKGSVGNPLAAAGPMQVAALAIGLLESRVPPTVNFRTRDPDCDLCLSAIPLALAHRVALVNTHGVNGTNSALILKAAL